MKNSCCRQSPINICPSKIILSRIDKNNKKLLDIKYKNKEVNLIREKNSNNFNFKVNNSENLIAEYNGTNFYLDSCHLHNKSEHRINNQEYLLEVHLVHKNDSCFLVMAFFINYKEGSSCIFDNMILQKNNHDFKLKNIVDNKFYKYQGSLTTTPYSENVTWIVFDKILFTSIDIDKIKRMWKNLALSRDLQNYISKSEVLTFDS